MTKLARLSIIGSSSPSLLAAQKSGMLEGRPLAEWQKLLDDFDRVQGKPASAKISALATTTIAPARLAPTAKPLTAAAFLAARAAKTPTLCLAEFEKLPHESRNAFIRAGGKLSEATETNPAARDLLASLEKPSMSLAEFHQLDHSARNSFIRDGGMLA